MPPLTGPPNEEASVLSGTDLPAYLHSLDHLLDRQVRYPVQAARIPALTGPPVGQASVISGACCPHASTYSTTSNRANIKSVVGLQSLKSPYETVVVIMGYYVVRMNHM